MLSRSVVLFLSMVAAASATNTPTPQPISQHQGQGQAQGQLQVQQQGQIANGGNSTATGGNSQQAQSNSNTVTSSGGAGGNGGQGGSSNQAQSANNQGNSFSTSTVYKERLQAPSISAPPVYASGPCSSGKSLGLSIPGGGISGGKTVTDPLCDRREIVRVLTALNPALALRVACADPYVTAVATEDDCVYAPPVTVHAEQVNGTLSPPAVDLTPYATKEDLERAFKQAHSK